MSTEEVPFATATMQLRSQTHRRMARLFFGVAAGLASLGALGFLIGLLGTAPGARFGAVLACSLLATSALWAARRRDVASPVSLMPVVWAAVVMLGLLAVATGHGLRTVSLGFMALLACLSLVLGGPRAGLRLAAFEAAVLAMLAVHHARGGFPVPPGAQATWVDALIGHTLLLAGGIGAGWILRRLSEQAFRTADEREQRFRHLLNIAADHYFELDSQLRFSLIESTDQAGLAPQGQRRTEAMIGKPPWELADLRTTPERMRQHRADLEAHRPFNDFVFEGPVRDDHIASLSVTGRPRFDRHGQFVGYWGVTRDVTDQVAQEREVQRSRAMLEQLVSTGPDAITLTELATGRYVMVNRAFTQFTGYRSDEVIGRTSHELGIWTNDADREHVVSTVQRDGRIESVPITFQGKYGQLLLVTISAARFELDGLHYLVINARDVSRTERVRLEYEAILENATIGIAYTRDHHIVHGNRRCEEMFGYASGALVGKPSRVFWKSEIEYHEVQQVFGPQLAEGRPVESERWLTRADGSQFLCRVQAQAIDPTHPVRGGTIWLFEDVTERRRVEQALAQARDAAEAASRAKSAFLANMNHEIRTPLNGILGFTQLALRPDVDAERLRDYLRQIQQSAQGLAAIISDVLDLAKIEAGKLQVEQLPFSLNESLRMLRDTYAPLAEAHGLAFELGVEPEVPDGVVGDALRLRQVVGNYLSNALKFTESGRVRVHVHRRPDGRVQFDVEDTGPGIAPDVRERLFVPFSQADTSTTRRFGGTGLGLSICRELATLMRGEVGVASQPGVGSRFWLAVPLPQAALSVAEAPPAIDDASALVGMRVLVAEDNPVNMMITVAMLEHWGVQATQVGDGEQAVRAARSAADQGRAFDAVLMDLQMPRMDGFAATVALRRHFDAAALPIIALTAAAMVSEREQGSAVGMTDFVTKPIDANRLREALLRCWPRVARLGGDGPVGAPPP